MAQEWKGAGLGSVVTVRPAITAIWKGQHENLYTFKVCEYISGSFAETKLKLDGSWSWCRYFDAASENKETEMQLF